MLNLMAQAESSSRVPYPGAVTQWHLAQDCYRRNQTTNCFTRTSILLKMNDYFAIRCMTQHISSEKP